MLSILGVPFAVPLAVMMSFFGLIPLVGATIGGVIILLVTLFTDFPSATIIYGIFLICYQQVENNVLQPFIFKRAVNVQPLAVIVAILAGSAVLGVVGALVAIPVAAARADRAARVLRRRRRDDPPIARSSRPTSSRRPRARHPPPRQAEAHARPGLSLTGSAAAPTCGMPATPIIPGPR